MHHASVKRRRVLIFLSCFAHGGAEKQGTLLAHSLQAAGFDVEVWGFPAPATAAPLKQQLDSWKIAHRELPFWPSLDWSDVRDRTLLRRLFDGKRSWPKQVARFVSRLPKAEFDIVVPFTFWPCLAACLMQQGHMARRVIWNHRGGFDAAGLSYSPFLVEQILQQHPVFVANSAAGAEFVRHVFAVDAKQVHIIHNAHVPEEEVDGPGSAVSSRDPGTMNLLHLANFFPEKDVETLLDAIASLKSGGLECVLQLAGGFPDRKYRRSIEKRVTDLGIADRVHLHGEVDRKKVHQLLREADIGLLSSRSEGMPNSVMEYMYGGLPVVATDIPGVRELVGEDNARWLFPVGDASRLQGLITLLASNRALRRELGIANRQRIIAEFDSQKIMQQWIGLLDAL